MNEKSYPFQTNRRMDIEKAYYDIRHNDISTTLDITIFQRHTVPGKINFMKTISCQLWHQITYSRHRLWKYISTTTGFTGIIE